MGDFRFYIEESGVAFVQIPSSKNEKTKYYFCLICFS